MKTLLSAAILAALAALGAAMPARAVMIHFDPLQTSATVGDRFGIDVIVSGLQGTSPEAEIVSAFDLDVLYDSQVLSAAAVEFGSALGVPDIDTLTSALLSPGRIDFANLSLLATTDLLALQNTNQVVLARLLFDAVGIGQSSLTFDANTTPGILLVGRDPFGSLSLSGVGQAEVIVGAPQPVPEPASLALCALGLILLGVVRLRRRAVARRLP